MIAELVARETLLDQARAAIALAKERGEAVAAFEHGPRFTDYLFDELRPVFQVAPNGRTVNTFVGVPLQVNPLLPNDMAVLVDYEGKIVGAIRL